MDLCPPKHRL